MSCISPISSSTSPYQPTNTNPYSQLGQDFEAIGSALQSGNLTTAQSALTTFQQDLQGNSPTSASQPFGKNAQANTDFQSLVSSLQSGDVNTAQKAFQSLQTDLKGAHGGHHHHHHATGSATAAAPTSSTTTAADSEGSTLNAVA